MRPPSHLLSVRFPCPQAQVEQEKQKISTVFEQLLQALKEEKNFLLSRINWLDQELTKDRNSYLASAEAQLQSLRKLKDSLKARQLLPPREMLQVRVPGGPSCKELASLLVTAQRTDHLAQYQRRPPLSCPRPRAAQDKDGVSHGVI